MDRLPLEQKLSLSVNGNKERAADWLLFYVLNNNLFNDSIQPDKVQYVNIFYFLNSNSH